MQASQKQPSTCCRSQPSRWFPVIPTPPGTHTLCPALLHWTSVGLCDGQHPAQVLLSHFLTFNIPKTGFCVGLFLSGRHSVGSQLPCHETLRQPMEGHSTVKNGGIWPTVRTDACQQPRERAGKWILPQRILGWLQPSQRRGYSLRRDPAPALFS